MRDWAKTLRRASFRGVDFWVDYEDFTGGKRLALHEYAGGQVTFIEEMGLKTSSYDVTAYLLGDNSDTQSQALAGVCLAPGPGRLVLPIDGGVMAHVEDFRRTRERDRAGYVAFSFRAIPKSNFSGASLGAGDVIAVFLSGLASAVPGFGRLF